VQLRSYLFFLSLSSLPAFSFVRPGICRQALGAEGFEGGSGAALPNSIRSSQPELLKAVVDPYGKGVPREAHETEREGHLYNLGEKFDSRTDEKGKLRRDGRYLFVVARDVDGARRIMTVPRFDFERADGKYLSTHRSMFRKYPDVFGPNPQIEVMGELEIRKGIVLGYNSKAGTAFDANEAENPDLFHARKQIAESMGIDLSKADRVVNFAEIASLDVRQQGRALGRHLDEAAYVETVKAMRDHPMTKTLLKKYDDLIQRAYALFPDLNDPKRILDMNSPLLKDISSAVDGTFLVRLSSSQEDSPVVTLLGSVINREEGALEFARDMDIFEQIVLHGENMKSGKSTADQDRTIEKGPLEKQYAAMMLDSSDSSYKNMRSKVFELSGKAIDPIAARKMLKVGKWIVQRQHEFLLNSGQGDALMDTQFLLTHMQERYGEDNFEGSFNFEKFSREFQVLEDDQVFDEGVAKQMLHNLLLESSKPDGDPTGLYASYLQKAESAHEDDMYDNPRPDLVVSSLLRAMGIRRLIRAEPDNKP